MSNDSPPFGRAVCWELSADHGEVIGLRVLLIREFIGMQLLVSNNQRPRWTFDAYPNAETAAKKAVAQTQDFEVKHGGTMAVPPGEIRYYHSELESLRTDSTAIPASLRTRIFTSLTRRDR